MANEDTAPAADLARTLAWKGEILIRVSDLSYVRGVARGVRSDQGVIGAQRARWPLRRYHSVPDVAVAAEVAQALRAAAYPELPLSAPLLDLRQLCELGGFRVRDGDLNAARGGTEALLLPLDDDQFQIVFDPIPFGDWRVDDPGLRDEITRHRRRFRIAHEIAHSFFFLRRLEHRPRRMRLVDDAEERWCDEFAARLLVPEGVAAGVALEASSVVTLHQDYDVSLHVAARAVARRHSGSTVVIGYWRDETPDLRTPLGLQSVQLQYGYGPRGRGAAAQAGLETSLGRWAHGTSIAILGPPRRQVVVVAPGATATEIAA